MNVKMLPQMHGIFIKRETHFYHTVKGKKELEISGIELETSCMLKHLYVHIEICSVSFSSFKEYL